MTDCEYLAADILCANPNNRYCGNYCPVLEHQDVCLYSTHNTPVRDVYVKVMQPVFDKIDDALINGTGGK